MIIRRDHVVLWQHCGNLRSRQLSTLSAASQQKASVPTGRGWRSTCPIACSITAGANRRTNRMESHSANLREIKGGSLSSEAPCMCAVCRRGTYCQTIKRRPSEPFEQEACPSPRPGRYHGYNAKTVSMLCRVTTQNVLRSHVFCLVTD